MYVPEQQKRKTKEESEPKEQNQPTKKGGWGEGEGRPNGRNEIHHTAPCFLANLSSASSSPCRRPILTKWYRLSILLILPYAWRVSETTFVRVDR